MGSISRERAKVRGRGVQLFQVGDVVTTKKKVACYTTGGAREGHALPGWLWRITEVLQPGEGKGRRYLAVAHTAPNAYKATLVESNIAGIGMPMTMVEAATSAKWGMTS